MIFLVFNLFVFQFRILGKQEFCISVGVLGAIHVVVITGVLGLAFGEYLRAGICFSLIVVSFD